jgi:hypothetical protein
MQTNQNHETIFRNKNHAGWMQQAQNFVIFTMLPFAGALDLQYEFTSFLVKILIIGVLLIQQSIIH